MSNGRLGRFEGRLFSDGGTLFMVVEADEELGTARVSCRRDGINQVLDVPLADVVERLVSGTGLVLDNLNGCDSLKRVQQKKNGWFFAAREGLKGPFVSSEEAQRQLARYVIAMQSPELRDRTRRVQQTAVQ